MELGEQQLGVLSGLLRLEPALDEVDQDVDDDELHDMGVAAELVLEGAGVVGAEQKVGVLLRRGVGGIGDEDGLDAATRRRPTNALRRCSTSLISM